MRVRSEHARCHLARLMSSADRPPPGSAPALFRRHSDVIATASCGYDVTRLAHRAIKDVIMLYIGEE